MYHYASVGSFRLPGRLSFMTLSDMAPADGWKTLAPWSSQEGLSSTPVPASPLSYCPSHRQDVTEVMREL